MYVYICKYIHKIVVLAIKPTALNPIGRHHLPSVGATASKPHFYFKCLR